MIIFGDKKETVAKGKIFSECGNCNKKNEFSYTVESCCFHVFFIPTFPSGKEVSIKCSNCNEIYRNIEIDKDTKLEILEKHTFKTNYIQFLGLFLITIFASLLILSNKSDNNLKKELFSKPQKNDVYDISISNTFTQIKIESVKEGSIIFYQSNYSTNLPSGLDEIKNKTNIWNLIPVEIQRKKLDSLMSNGKIINIRR